MKVNNSGIAQHRIRVLESILDCLGVKVVQQSPHVKAPSPGIEPISLLCGSSVDNCESEESKEVTKMKNLSNKHE